MKIVIAAILFVAAALVCGSGKKEPQKEKRKEKPADKSFFFDGADDFNDEDLMLLEIMEDDDI